MQATTGTKRVHLRLGSGAAFLGQEASQSADSMRPSASRCIPMFLVLGDRMSDDAKFILGFG
jgi:hypothetical protein